MRYSIDYDPQIEAAVAAGDINADDLPTSVEFPHPPSAGDDIVTTDDYQLYLRSVTYVLPRKSGQATVAAAGRIYLSLRAPA